MISSLSLHVSWKPMNPQECEWKNLYRNIMRTISQEKGTTHYSSTIWHTGLFLCLKQWSYPPAKAAVDKEWEKLEKIPAWDTKIRNKSEVIDEARKEGRKVIDGPLSFEECRTGDKAPKIKRSSLCSEATLCTMILGLMQYSQNKDHQLHKWRKERSWISYPDCQVAQDKQLTQDLLVLRSK